jgi:hypothetical protein
MGSADGDPTLRLVPGRAGIASSKTVPALHALGPFLLAGDDALLTDL